MVSKQHPARQSSHVVGLQDLNQVARSLVVDLVITANSVFLDLLLIQFQTQKVDMSRILRNRHV